MDVTPAPERLLRLACAQKKRDDVVKLLEEGADPNSELAKDINSGATPLHFACWHGWLDVVTWLCGKHNFDANIVDFEQRTPLHYACRNGHLNIVIFLLMQGCKIDVTDKKKRTPLHHACEKNNVEVVQYFSQIEFGITSSYDKTEVLMMACRNGCLEIVKNIDVEGTSVETLIVTACKNNHVDIVSYLIIDEAIPIPELIIDKVALSACSNGCLKLLIHLCNQLNCNTVLSVRDPDDQQTLFHCACQNGYLDIVHYLTEQKCDPHTVDKYDRTPLHLAAQNGHLQIIQLLIIKLNCKPNVKDSQQQTPLHYACKHGKLDVVQYLVDEHGCNSNQMDENQQTPIAYACQLEHLEILLYFVSKRTVFSDQNKIEILKLACKHGQINLFDYVIKQIDGDDDTHRKKIFTDEYQQNLLCLTCRHGHKDMLDYLISTMQICQPQLKERNDLIPLKLALQKGHMDILQCFVDNCDIHDITMFICKYGELDVFKAVFALIADKYPANEQGCILSVTDKYGATLLHYASQLGHVHKVDYLISEHKFDPEVRNGNDGTTPLHYACQYGHVHVAEFLISKQACNPEAVDLKHRTPLHLACEYGKLDIVEYLTRQGCIMCAVALDWNQKTPLYYAFKNTHEHIVSFFINKIGDENHDEANTIVVEIFNNACEFGRINIVRILKALNFTGCCNAFDGKTTPLHRACQHGHLGIVKLLMKFPCCNPAAEDTYGQTPLHYALQYSHINVVHYFVNNCDFSVAIKAQVSDPVKVIVAHVNKKPCIDKGREDLLVLACKVGHVEFFKLFFQNQRDINCDSGNLLHLACKYGHMDIIKYLLGLENNDQQDIDDFNRTSLHFACESGHLGITQYLIKEQNCNMNIKDNDQLTPLHYAIKNGHFNVVQYLIEEGCDLGKDDGNSIGLLHYAAMFGQKYIVSYLIMECSFNPEAKDRDQKTPLHYAALFGHRTVLQYLIVEHRCCPHARDKDLWTPLHFTCQGSHLEIANYLIRELGCDPQCLTRDQEAPLHIASRYDHVNMIHYLIVTENCNPNIRNANEMTPLHYACANGKMQSIVYLTELGCDPNVIDAEEQTPLHHACKNGFSIVANFLIKEKGCNPEVKDKYGNTPLLYALQNNHLETIKCLTTFSSVGHYCNEDDTDLDLELLFYFCKHGYTTLLDSITSNIHEWVLCREKNDRTPLHYACIYGHIDIVKYIVLYGDEKNTTGIEATDKYQLTPLNYACLYGHKNIVEYLATITMSTDQFLTHFLNSPGDSNSFQDFLFLACKVGHLGFVRLIVEGYKWNPDVYDEDQITPLHYACEGGHEDIVQFLFSKHPNLQYDDQEDVLFFACKRGQFELVVAIVEGQNFNPEVRDQDQRTPFYYACSNQHISIAQYLASQPGHSIYYRQEALITACQAGLLDIVKSIINGISEWDPEAKDENGHSLLHHASIYGRLNIMLYLVGEHHCDPVAEDDDHFTPLDCALQHGHKHVVEHFLDLDNAVYEDNVKVIDIINKSGFKWLTPLHIACQAGCVASVKYFITEKGYSSEVRDKSDRTPLHYAAINCHTDIVQYLINEMKCDPDTTDVDHLTPLDSVCCNFNANTEQGGDVVRILSSKTSHTKHTNSGNTPLHFACCYNNYVAAGILLSKESNSLGIKNNAGLTPLKLSSLNSFEIFGTFIQSQSTGTEIAYNELIFVRKEENSLQIMKKLIKQNKWDPNTRTNNGDNALHFACRSCKQKIILYLLRETNCDPNAKNTNGITPFLSSPDWIIFRPSYIRLFASHDATDSYIYVIANFDEEEALEFAKSLTTKRKWDLNGKDSTGETILHSACRANRPRIVCYLLSEGNCNPNVQNGAGITPIYYVLNPDIIGHLIKHGADLSDVYSHITSNEEDIAMNIIEHLSYYTTSWNPNRKTKSGEIMLHFAIKREQIKIVTHLLPLAMSDDSVEEDILLKGCEYLSQHNPDWDPGLMTSSGYNTLHLACITNKCTVVHFLLSEKCCDPNMVTKAGYFPLQLTSNPAIVTQLLRHGAKLPNVYQTHGKILGTKEPLKPPVKIFVVGDPSVGKSTLTAALQKELPLLARTFLNKKVNGVDEKTAGVVPHEFESKKFGRVTLYDFAGQREFYSSHAALLQNAVKHSSPIFLLVIDMTKANCDIEQNISYWASFIGNQCTFVTSKPHIIIVGSHADVLKAEGQDAKEKGHVINSFCAVSLGFNLEYIGFVPMDCQYFDSTGMSDLRHYLKKSCEILRIPENISFNAHCFQVYLRNRHPDTAAVLIKHVLATISDNEQGTLSDVASFIPSSIHYLLNICKELNERGHIIFLENSDDAKDSWIVLKKAALLSDVTGTIFAPEGFKQHCQLASSTGVVPLQKLMERFPNHSSDMLVGFLSHLEFCHEVIDHEVLKLIEKHQTETLETCSPDERYFFFPALVRLEREEGVWKKSKLYVSGWIMQCTQQEDFFTSRFLQVLFLRLAFNFAMVQSQEAIDYEVPSIQRRCSVWKSGIYWGTGHGVEALVEVLPDSKAIIFLVQGSNLLENIKLRSQVLKKIRDCVNDLYKDVKISEGFIDPSIITECPAHVKPSSILHMTEIAEAIISHESDSAVSPNGTPLSLEEFLMFEPFLELGKPLLQHLHNEHSEQFSKRITNEFVGALSNQIKRRDKVCIFQKIFSSTQIVSSDISQSICSWRNQTEGTYKCLKDRLDVFSIFTRRNIYELAGQLIPDSEATSASSMSGQVTLSLHPNMSSTPQLSLLYELNTNDGKQIRVIKSVAFKWEQLAIALGFDGATIEKIKRDKFHQSKDATAEMFQEWLESDDDHNLQGPVTWATLIQCLIDAELAEVAISLNLAITGNQEYVDSINSNGSGLNIPSLGDKPKLKDIQLLKGPDGRKVRIIDEVASEWEKLAGMLGFDAMEISCIKKDHHQDPVASCRQILDTWLQENSDNQLRDPVTWATLIQCLTEADCSILVQDLQMVLR